MLTIWIYSKNLRSLMSNCPLVIRTHCLVLVSIYPIVSLFSLTAIAIPRTYFFNDSAGHIAFMVISWHLYRLCMIYVDGEKNFISTSGDEAFTLKSPPLCCCLPLNRVPMTKSSSKFVKFLIIQMPITHILIFVVLNIIYIEDINAFDDLILYFIPFIALTVLGGIWGYNLVVRTLSPYYPNLKLIQKYFAFQLVLFFCKIFPILMNFIMKMIITSCYGPLTIVVKRHIIIQIQVQIQMFILSLWAMRLYKDPMMK
ncbi:unnamed protein product [Chironomus riparius]|uniref:Uncharacterized protein n=1 Tax=Chironomus riparius TaxID=315576 RepID=A0A9N9RZB3_9DIPT|nr:unnamed protein product [Chironomus riparius]